MASVDDLMALLVEASGMPLGVAAQGVAGAGVPVFPCVPGGKRPLVSRGFLDATVDVRQVAAWWRDYPSANVGVPTGAVSGVVVVDVDVYGWVPGFAAFDRAMEAGLVGGWQALVDTPSGGMHAYYLATPGVVQRCWQAAAVGIDFRGDGGYVVVPPSIVRVDGVHVAYRVRAVNVEPGLVVDSVALRDLLDPRPVRPRGPVVRALGDVDVSRLAAWVASRGEGERNRGLFWAACRMAENGTSLGDALDVLTDAAGHAGLGEREIATTVRSAYRSTHPLARCTQQAASVPDGRLGGSVAVDGRRL